jgi:hypothetical protein
MQRRTFLKRGLFGGALLSLGGLGLALQPSRSIATPSKPLAVLDPIAFQVVAAIALRVLPFEGVDAGAVATAVDGSLGLLPKEVQGDVVALLHLFESALSGALFDLRMKPFTMLDGPAQDQVLMRWRDSQLVLRRGGYQALRKLCLAAFYAHDTSWKAIGYGGPPNTAGFFHDDSKAGDRTGKG